MGLFGGGGHDTVTRADKISNFTVATAEYGAPVMELLGTTRISGNVIYYDDFTAHEHREEQRTGKGGGGSTATNITYTYTVAAILGLCEGPINTVRRIWVNKEIYTYPSAAVPLTLFLGTQNQQPWSYVVGKHPDRALAYEGLAYMAGVIDLGSNAGMPSYNFEVCGKLLDHNDGTDVNPMDYIRYVLSKVGQGSTTINGEENFRSYCSNADLLISTPSEATGTEEAQKIVNDIANLCGAYFFWSNDAYKIVPLADRPVSAWTPDKTIRYDLTPDDFVPQNGSCITWSRKDSSEQYNRWTVEFQNRANNYEKESVTYEDVDNIAERGVMQAPTIQARYIYTKERAVVVAEAAARRGNVEKNQYKFRLGWAFCRLEPGDLVRITDEASGISNTVVMIKSIDEDASGFLSVTAVSWFQADYGAAEYDVHEVDRPDFDFNAPPGNTDVPAIFQPPADLTANGLELWLAAKGLSENWGGCTVYVSDDNEHYRTVGQITNNARFGPLVTGIGASATSMEVTINGTMLSGTELDAERANTLLWVGGECLSYGTATLLQNGNYLLSGLLRGQYNTTAASHSAGDIVVRCDEALLRAPFSKEDVGKTLYLKFCSFNIFGAAEQSLADVQAYQYTLQPYYIPPVSNLNAYNRYRQIQDGVVRYDIVVTWTPPNLQSYLEGQVWYKTDHGQISRINDVAEIPVSQLGFQGDWIYGGSGKNQVVIPQAVVGDTYRIAVITKDEWGVATSPDASPQTTITVALRTETPNTPDDFSITYGAQIKVSWSEVTNADIQFYEIRTDAQAGIESPNLLARTTGTSTALTLTTRTGTLYLFAKSPVGKYSAPAKLIYAKDVPSTPEKPDVSANLGSINIVAGAIPNGCLGMRVYINGDGIVSAFTENNTYTHSCEAGIYDVSVAYVDIFGEGARSTASRIVIKKTIDAKLLEDEAVNIAKVDSTIKAALEDAVNSANDLITVHSDINTINARVTEVQAYGEGVHNELVETNNNVTRTIAQVDKNSADVSQLSQDVNSLQTTIENFHIEGDVGETVEYLQSQITQNANSINSTVNKLNSAPGAEGQYFAISQLKQTADGLTSTVAQKVDTSTESEHYNNLTSSINQQANRITSVITELNKTSGTSSYSAIAQMQDNIDLRVVVNDETKAKDVMTQLNLTPGTARIRGKLITLDGDVQVAGTFFSNAVQAKSIDAAKINASSLSALTANFGEFTTSTSAGKVVIKGSLIEVWDTQRVRVRIGLW